MKFKKADTETLFEALNNGVCFKGKKHNLIGTFIGTLEIKVDWDIEEYYPAVKLPTGEIVGALDDNTVFSLVGKSFFIHWGEYAPSFPDELKTKLECPKTLKRLSHQEIYAPAAQIITDKNELPF